MVLALGVILPDFGELFSVCQ